MNADALSWLAALRYDFVHSCDIHGITAKSRVLKFGKFALRVTLFGIYCVDMFMQGSTVEILGTYSSPSISSPLPPVLADSVRMLSPMKRSKETAD